MPEPREGGRIPRPAGANRRVGRELVALLVLGVVAGLLGSALVLPLATAAGASVNLGDSVFDSLPSAAPQVSLPQTSVMLAADGTTIAHFYDENRTEVPLSQISPQIQHAIVAVEDARFFEHGAIDPRGLVRAIVRNESGDPAQGASTLTQQYVKNLMLEQALQSGNHAAAEAAVARTMSRKLHELRLAVTVEQHLTKPQILERYLNTVYFGEGAYGIQAAAERYFGRPASALTVAQAALLAGLVQDPAAYDPVTRGRAARARRDLVLADMHAQGMITAAQLSEASASPVKLTGRPLPEGCATAGSTGFFCDYVVQSILNDAAYSSLGTTAVQRRHSLFTGGLVIHTTLDRPTQGAAVRSVNSHVPPNDSSHLGAAAVTVEPGTGAVLAMAENRTYSVTPGRSRTSVNYTTDSALGGATGFQTGSSFKPFTLATWLAGGRSLDDKVDATKRGFPFSDFTSCGQPLRGTQPYVPGNSEGTETGRMSVLDATVNSVNVAYVDMETRLDLCDVVSTAQSLGVHLATPRQVCTATGTPTTALPTCLPSLTLGVEDIAPLTMAAAYAGFATGGEYCVPMPITSIDSGGSPASIPGTSRGTSPDSSPGTSPDSSPGTGPAASPSASTASTLSYHPTCHQAVSPDVASGVTRALRQVLTRGTAAAMGPLSPWPSAGKTGTTDGPYDTWFVGYTAQRSTAVWVGDPGRESHGSAFRRQLTNITVDGQYYPIVFGASIAAPIWKSIMTTAMNGLSAQPLP